MNNIMRKTYYAMYIVTDKIDALHKKASRKIKEKQFFKTKSAKEFYNLLQTYEKREKVYDINYEMKNARDIRAYQNITDKIIKLGNKNDELLVRILIFCCVAFLCECMCEQERDVDSIYKLLDTVALNDPDAWSALDLVMYEDGKYEGCSFTQYYKYVRENAGNNFRSVVLQAKAIIFPYLCLKNKDYKYNFIGLGKKDEDKLKTKVKEVENTGENNSVNLADPLIIKEFLDKDIVGQDATKKVLSVALANHITAYQNNLDAPHSTILIIGPTGSGKTFLAQKLSEYSGLPCAFIDATQLTGDGWRGLDKVAPIREMYKSCEEDEKRAKYGIVILDEFDKLMHQGATDKDFTHDKRASVLSMLDGLPVRNPSDRNSGAEGEEYPTKNFLFILTGSFEDMEKVEKISNKKRTIGFNAENNSRARDNHIRQRLMDYGIPGEVVGRISSIVYTEPLDTESILSAVLDKEGSFFKQYKKLLSCYEKNIEIDRKYAKDIIDEHIKQGLGVRGAKSTLDEVINRLVYKAFEQNEENIVVRKEDVDFGEK